MFQAERKGRGLQLRYDLTGDLSQIRLVADGGGARRDELWKQTCFEAFLRADCDARYIEFNFAPNGDWAAYQFEKYRSGCTNLPCDTPEIKMEKSPNHTSVLVEIDALPLSFSTGQIHLGPAAILQTLDGARSYWALHHPGQTPDFHRAETFKINLE